VACEVILEFWLMIFGLGCSISLVGIADFAGRGRAAFPRAGFSLCSLQQACLGSWDIRIV
jgi:hypothetical protein